MEHHLRWMASKGCVHSFRISDPNYRSKQMASGDAQDPWVKGQQIGTQSLKKDLALNEARAANIAVIPTPGKSAICATNPRICDH